ncbi:MAG: glycosyltransferase family 4 protein [Acidimicrobiales bacterium]
MALRRAPHQVGGVERMVASIVDELRRARPYWKVSTLSAFRPGSRLEGLDGFDDVVAALRLGWRLRRSRDRVDVILLHCPELAWGIWLFNRPGRRPPVVVVWHGAGAAPFLALRPAGNLLSRGLAAFRCAEERLARPADRHVAVESHLVEQLRSYYGIVGAMVIENALDPSVVRELSAPRRERSGEPVTFVWVGQTGYRKGLDVVLAAFARLRHLVPAVQLLVVGVAAGEPAEGVEWVGPLPPEQVPAVYRRADVLFFPTRYEALPLVVIEAMTAGLPAVVSDAVAPGIVADGRAGYVIAGHDPDDYVPALQRLCDPELRAEMSSQARVESERFSLERAVRRYAEVAESVAITAAK